MSTLSQTTSIVIYKDSTSSNNPRLKYPEWKRTISGQSVSNPLIKELELPPYGVSVVFDASWALSTDIDTELSLSLNPQLSSVYRLAYVSGTDPVFRTTKTVATNTRTFTITINNNATALFTLSASGLLTQVSVGDIVYIPDTSMGDSVTSPFNDLNVGFWVVLGKTTSSLTLTRLPGESFSGTAEAVVITNDNQFTVFSSDGVQVGDTLAVTGGTFSTTTQGKTFVISKVTDKFLEFTSAESLALQASILPTATGMYVYSGAKQFIRIESDQMCQISLNDDAGGNLRLSPRIVGDFENGAGHFELWGHVWKLSLLNLSKTSTANIVIISVE